MKNILKHRQLMDILIEMSHQELLQKLDKTEETVEPESKLKKKKILILIDSKVDQDYSLKPNNKTNMLEMILLVLEEISEVIELEK